MCPARGGRGGDRLSHSGGGGAAPPLRAAQSPLLCWEKRLWTEPPPALLCGHGRCWADGRRQQTQGRWPLGRRGSLGPGSSLTVFFVDLHQGLVGLLCSCQTVLRLGRGSHQVRPWPPVASPSLACCPDPRESGLPTRCCQHTKHAPPGRPSSPGGSPTAFPPRSQHAFPAVGVPGPLFRCRQPSGLVPLSPREGSLGLRVAQAASGPGSSLCWLRTAPVPSPSPAWH